MSRHFKLCMLVTFWLCIVVFAGDPAPLSMQDIGNMRIQKKSSSQIIEAIEKHGVNFQMNKEIESRLKTMRFTSEEIERIGKVADGSFHAAIRAREEQKAKWAQTNKERWEQEKPKAAQSGEAPSTVDIGPRLSKQRLDGAAASVQSIWKASNTDTKMFDAETITLVCSQKSSEELMPLLKKTEKEIRSRFQEPIKTGLDRRCAYLVMLDTKTDFEYWINKLFEAAAKNGGGLDDPELKKSVLESGVLYTSYMVIFDLSRRGDHKEHSIAHALGMMYLDQLIENRAPDAISGGFANVCEVQLKGSPMNRVNSYVRRDPRDFAGSNDTWQGIVNDRMTKGTLSSIDKILRFSAGSMLADEYCEAWSLTSYLAQSPEQFARWLIVLRDRKEEKPLEALERIWCKPESELTKEWHDYIKSQN